MDDQALGIATQVIVMAIVISVILLFLGILGLVLIHICIAGRAFRRRIQLENSRGNLGNSSMSRDDVEKLPCFDFKPKESDASTTATATMDCAVCLDNFNLGDKCRLLPICNHSFHAHCVDLWLLRTPICPICRTNAEESNHLGEIVVEFGESQTPQSGDLNDNGDELRRSQSVQSTHLEDAETEPRDYQYQTGVFP